jgi:hypothetical protein
VVLTGTQVAFRVPRVRRPAGIREAAESRRAGRGGAVAFASYHPLSASIAAQVRKVRAEFFDAAKPPAGSLLLFESLPSSDAGFAIDVVAIKN